MTDKAAIRRIAELYLEGAPSDIPMSDDIEYRGPMVPEALRGEAAVREYLAETAPFASLELRELLVSDDSAAALVELVLVNGKKLPGSVFMRIRDERLAFVEVLFDSHPLYAAKG